MGVALAATGTASLLGRFLLPRLAGRRWGGVPSPDVVSAPTSGGTGAVKDGATEPESTPSPEVPSPRGEGAACVGWLGAAVGVQGCAALRRGVHTANTGVPGAKAATPAVGKSCTAKRHPALLTHHPQPQPNIVEHTLAHARTRARACARTHTHTHTHTHRIRTRQS